MVRLEIFSGDPPRPGCAALVTLAKRIAPMYTGELESAVYMGADAMEKFEEYRLFCVPAAVVNCSIRVEGICPSEATLNNALREGGLCPRQESRPLC